MIPVYSFFTKDTPYEEAADLFLAHFCTPEIADHFELHLNGKQNRGNWAANCNIKPEYIFAAIQRGVPFIYLDIDARIEQPECVLEAFDQFIESGKAIGAHYKGGTELLSGTLFINPEADWKVFRKWMQLSQSSPGMWDQKMLCAAVTATETDVHRLTPQMTFIFDIMARENPGMTGAIVHYQYSRRFRAAVNKGVSACND